MRAMLFAVAAAVGLWATPACAQFWGGAGPAARAGPPIWGKPAPTVPPLVIDSGVARELADFRDQVNDGRRSGQLTRREARALRREGAVVARLQQRYRSGGLSASERAELATRVELLRDDLNALRSGER